MTERPFRRQLLRNTFASGMANVWAMVAALAAVPLLTSGLGRVGFGVWALVMTFSATNGWMSLADLGVVVATTRDVSSRLAVDDAAGARSVVTDALCAVAALGVVGGGGLALASLLLPGVFGTPDDLVGPFRVALAIMGAQVVLDLFINVAEAALEGTQRVDLSRAVDSFRRLAFVVGVSVAAVATGDVRWVAVGSIAATAASLVLALVVLARHLPRFLVRPSAAGVRGLVRRGRSVAVLRPLGVLQRTMDRMLVGVVLGPGAVALVEVATQLQAGADAVLSASSYSVVPSSAWLHARGDRRSLTRLAEIGTKYSLLATVPVAVGVATLAGPFIELWIGDRYADAAGLTAVAALAVVLSAPLAVGSQLLLGLDRTTAILRAAGAALVVNLAASALLVQVVGIVGAMWGTVIATPVLLAVLGPPVMAAAGTDGRRFVRVAVLPVLAPAAAQLGAALALLAIDLDPLPRLGVVGAGSLAAFVAVAWHTLDRRELQELRLR